MLSNVGEIQEPCLTPLFVDMSSASLSPISKIMVVFSYILQVTFRRCIENPRLFMMLHRSLRLLLNAFSKSMKARWVSRLNSLRFSIICLRVKIASVHDLPFLKLICYSDIIVSLIVLIHLFIIWVYILFVLSNKRIPL